MNDFQPIPFRIRIGVTGHRSLPDPAAVEQQVRNFLDRELDGLFSAESHLCIDRVRKAGVTPIAFSAVTPLAEGADRAVARAISSFPGSRIDVVLPLTVADYLQDFQQEESRREFLAMVEQARRPVFLRSLNIEAEASSDEQAHALRQLAYEEAGQYVVSHCDLLIAVWNGQPSRGRGGTADIVDYAKAQGRPVVRIWNGAVETYDFAHGLNAAGLDAIDRFNREPISPAIRQQYLQNLIRDYFEKPAAAPDVPKANREIVEQYFFPGYVQASVIAKRNQQQFYAVGRAVYWRSAIAVACVALAALLPKEGILGWLQTGLFIAELGLLWTILRNLHRAHHDKVQQAWMEHRFLAERIRAGTFLAICGIEAKPMELLPFMGGSQSANDWMVRVYDEIWNSAPRLAGCSHGECLLLNRYIREKWLDAQASFHRGKRERERKARFRLEKWGRYVLPITMGAAALHVLLKFLGFENALAEAPLTFIALVLPALAASLAGMLAHREHLRLEKRSESMAPQLEYLSRRMASASEPASFELLLHQADELMLRETQDWLTLMRDVEVRH